MCGIAGWINLKENISTNEKIIGDMTDTLLNRGPDASGRWISSHALIGHRRLIVVDPAGGSQPMVRNYGDNTYVISYNGELYNTMELRSRLENYGHRFHSFSDTEVLLVSYINWGTDCTAYLNGIYAFAVWDEKEQSLFLARDRFGVKPLFYTQKGNSFIFGSELKTLLSHPFIEASVDSEGLAEVFSLGPAKTPGHGIFKGIREVKPAHYILHNNNGTFIRRYWKLESKPHTDNLYDTVDKVNELVNDSITRQLSADVPVCTFLSGGLDSSAITAIAADVFNKTGKGRLHTYSVDFSGNAQYFKPSHFQPDSDGDWIKRMSEEYNTLHHFITFDSTQLAKALEEAVTARDLPGMADVDSSLWLFCREIKKDATVALSGECAISLVLLLQRSIQKYQRLV